MAWRWAWSARVSKRGESLHPIWGLKQARQRRIRPTNGLQSNRVREVALEVSRINDRFRKSACGTQLYDNPILTRRTTPTGFPTATHIFRGMREDQVVHRRKTCHCKRWLDRLVAVRPNRFLHRPHALVQVLPRSSNEPPLHRGKSRFECASTVQEPD